MARAQFDFGGTSVPRPKARRSAWRRSARDRPYRRRCSAATVAARPAASRPGASASPVERVGLERRHLGAGRALPIGDREHPAVEDRVCLAAIDREMDVAREPSPRSRAPGRRPRRRSGGRCGPPRCRRDRAGRPARSSCCAGRPARCACRSTRRRRPRRAPAPCAMPSPVLKRARGASSGMPSPPGPKCSRIMSRLPWKPPQASTTASAASDLAAAHAHAADRAALR